MLFDNIPIIDSNLVSSIPWDGDGETYDQQLHSLGSDDKFLILNPDLGKEIPFSVLNLIKKIPTTDKCVVWHYEFNWIAKLFPKNWTVDNYLFVPVKLPRLVWTRNPTISNTVEYDINPIKEYKPNLYDLNLKMIWYIDKKVNPTDTEEWVMSCTYHGFEHQEDKIMGVLDPLIDIEWNPDLPKLNLEVEDLYPPFWNLDITSVWSIDDRFSPEEDTWLVKFTPKGADEESWNWLGMITPDFTIEENPDLPKLNLEIDYTIPWHDLAYIHTWYIDEKIAGERVWALKIIPSTEIVGEKDMGAVVPRFKIEQNPSLPRLEFKIDYDIPWHDLAYEHIWYLNKKINGKKIWAVKVTPSAEIKGLKEMGTIEPLIPDQLDVIFISYFESNADQNWQRLLEKAPWAKRVDGVKGIFAAHQEAARISETDMFYVVDGDAWLVDEFNFDFQPTLFDRDCAYVWSSINPVNGLIYQNGGVKLFNREILLKKKSWKTLDMFTGIMPKIKSEDKVSCVAAFNVDEFSTWRSAFRESVKLYTINQMNRLNTWMTKGKTKPFGKYAIEGAQAGYEYALANKDALPALLKINDRDWLQKEFNKQYGR